MVSDDSSSDECNCHHVRSQHIEGLCLGCKARDLGILSRHSFIGPEPEKPALMCTCGHSRNWHPRANGYACMGDNCLDCAEFTCDHTRCGWKPREGPEEEAHDFSSPSHCKACMSTWIGRGVAAMEDEPPLTPEEEEEAPSDRRCTVCAGSHPQGDCVLCECDHDRSMHDIVGRWCTAEGCDCTTFRGLPLAGAEPPPPQPERRPPYVVAYSVSGHLYEVALSGDATVRAADGALVIQHHLGPVAGIVSVAPVINKESNG